jgi:hypothetical protein
MTTLLKESGTGLTTITGVGTLIAARIVGEVGRLLAEAESLR